MLTCRGRFECGGGENFGGPLIYVVTLYTESLPDTGNATKPYKHDKVQRHFLHTVSGTLVAS